MQNLKVKLIVTPTAAEDGKIALTTKDGYTLGVSNGKVVDASLGSLITYGSFALSVQLFDNDGETPATAEQIAQLKTDTTGIEMQVVAGARTRVSSLAPSGEGTAFNTDFAAKFGNSYQNKFKVKLTTTTGKTKAAEAVSLSVTTGYYAVGGDASANKAKSEYNLGTDLAQAETVGSVKASISTGAWTD